MRMAENNNARNTHDNGSAQESPQNGDTAPAAPAAENDRTKVLLAKLEEAQKAAETYRDQLLRKAAEFENYKRRTEADVANVIRNANEALIFSLLPILDDFDRSLKHGKDHGDYDAFYRGVELIQSKLQKILDAEGLTPFESVGKPFDVAYHDALLQVPRPDVPPHSVVEEVERGYLLNDKVLRHARVIVSAEPQPTPEQPNDAANQAGEQDG